jgi:DHA1 family tetracycline resistance protein-like MFS transporter
MPQTSKKILPVLFVTLLLDVIGIGMVIPIIPVIFTDPTSAGFLLHGYSSQAQYFIAGTIIAMFGIMQFLAAPILGELSDAFGRKKILTICIGVLALAQLLFGMGIELGLLWLLFVSRIVAGIAGANFSIAQAVIADVSTPKDRAKNFGLIGAAFGFGFVSGPLLSGWLASITGNPAFPFWFASFLGIINLLFVSLMLKETHKGDASKHQFHILKGLQNILIAFRDVDARPVFITSLFFASGFAFFTTFSSIFLVSRFGFHEGEIGTYFGIVGVWIVITQVFILRVVTKHYTERQILLVALPTLCLAIGTYPFLPSPLFAYSLVPFIAVPVGLSMANITALISKGVSPSKQGAALGINGSLNAFAQGITPLLSGIFGALLGVTAPFIFGSLGVFLGWYVLFNSKKR